MPDSKQESQPEWTDLDIKVGHKVKWKPIRRGIGTCQGEVVGIFDNGNLSVRYVVYGDQGKIITLDRSRVIAVIRL